MIALVVAMPRLRPGRDPGRDAPRIRRAIRAARRAVIAGGAEALELVRRREVTLIAGAIGYWAFDNAVLGATSEAFGADVPLTVILMAT